ncbi:transposase [Streptomyces sp. NPDC050508]|uniref:transposase n=1 Tax=Streptomyces sp. NPDC050508 TaxID=3155405 RepID=UPI00341B9C83
MPRCTPISLNHVACVVDQSKLQRPTRDASTGPSPVDRRKTGSKHHLVCDGRGTSLKVITTAANVNDVTQTLALVEGIPPVAGRPGRSRRRPDSLLGDSRYDSKAVRDELRNRRILPAISRKGAPNINGLANPATSWSRSSHCFISSSASPSAGNAEPNSTTPSSHSMRT